MMQLDLQSGCKLKHSAMQMERDHYESKNFSLPYGIDLSSYEKLKLSAVQMEDDH